MPCGFLAVAAHSWMQTSSLLLSFKLILTSLGSPTIPAVQIFGGTTWAARLSLLCRFLEELPKVMKVSGQAHGNLNDWSQMQLDQADSSSPPAIQGKIGRMLNHQHTFLSERVPATLCPDRMANIQVTLPDPILIN
jgi:hypothetical protein